jgi:hypothetical protein
MASYDNLVPGGRSANFCGSSFIRHHPLGDIAGLPESGGMSLNTIDAGDNDVNVKLDGRGSALLISQIVIPNAPPSTAYTTNWTFQMSAPGDAGSIKGIANLFDFMRVSIDSATPTVLHFQFPDIPDSSTGLEADDVYWNSGVLTKFAGGA